MGWGLADSRLTSTSESTRGCGGVGVIWRRNLCCTTIYGSDSDRMCGIRIKTKNSQDVLSIIAVYLPIADLGPDYYRECLTELERITEDSKQLGPTIIMGDFNAHLGTLGGPKGCGDPNSQGVLLHELLRRSDLFVASLSNHAEGPDYTFWRGDTHTTVDYVLMDVDAASIMSSCMIHEVACLNTSDHLPLSVTVNVPTDSIELVNDLPTRIDWTKAEFSGATLSFQAAITDMVCPLIPSMHDNINSVNAEIKLVTECIIDSAALILSKVKPRKQRFFRDSTLKQICGKSKGAWKAWVDADRPPYGPLYNSKNHWRREVRKRVNICAAMNERKRVSRRENLFRSGSRNRFCGPHKRKPRCSKLKVGNNLITDKEDLLHIWADYFTMLSKSKIKDTEGLQHLNDKVQCLYNSSLSNEEYILDTSLTLEELMKAIDKLKMRKVCGPDGVLAEHLKYGGQPLHTWLLKILHCIVELEAIPDMYKYGSITPVYKRGGKDPLDKNSYRGITVTSVLAKLLEYLILERLNVVLLESGVPHVNQTAYRRHVGCADAIFATQETIAKHVREGSTVYMCLYDLQKAFDSVEFPVLLDRLYSIGVSGKTWRIIKNWYDGSSCCVKLEDGHSNIFPIERGVRQGSVLSPTLFLLVIDPLLREMESANLGLTINNFFVGGFAHADDIRTITNSIASLNAQLESVSSFSSNNFLQLNPSKCEIVSFSRQSTISQPQLSLDVPFLPVEMVPNALVMYGIALSHPSL